MTANSPVIVTGPIPVTRDSFPFNAADRQYRPVGLASYGYIEEEFFISGLADIYQWYYSFTSPATILASGFPYTTRILVRRPKDPARFSGNVIVEMFNWARKYDDPWGGWGECYSYFLAHGDAWVGVTLRIGNIAGLKNFNPERYSSLALADPVIEVKKLQKSTVPAPAEEGLMWDIFSQAGALMKSAHTSNPLAGYRVEYVLATGATGGGLSAYVSAIHPLAILDGEKPIYDGYVIKCTGVPDRINRYEPRMPPDDPRCKLYANVPVIRVQTQGDILGVGYHPDWSLLQRRPDGDAPGEQFRLYEVAGSYIETKYPILSGPCQKDAEATGGKWRGPCEVSDHEFPLRYIMNGAFANLDLWGRRGVTPPHAEPLGTAGNYPDTVFTLDEFGNNRGGVRTPYVDVPVATYSWNGVVTPFDNSRLKQKYGESKRYLNKVIDSTEQLLRDRWIIKADAAAIINQAARLYF
jgi:hypothetical protein